jgi:hypothetical protein
MGIGLGSLVFIVLLILKLAGIGVVATWSWWWVTAPLWAPLAIVLAIIAVIGIGGLIIVSVSR